MNFSCSFGSFLDGPAVDIHRFWRYFRCECALVFEVGTIGKNHTKRLNPSSYLTTLLQTSVIRWGYEALCINEFTGLKLTPTAKRGPLSVSTGEEVSASLPQHRSY
jgi:hypothetical protein